MNSKQQNRGIPIPQPALKLLVLIAIFLFLLFIGGTVFGASPFTDNFDSYDVGNLVPQGSWATTTSQSVLTTTTDYYSSPNSAWWTSGNYDTIKEGDHEITGEWVFRAKINSDAGTHGEITAVGLTGATYSNTASVLIFSCVANDCETTELVKVEACIGGGSGMVEIDQIPIDEWINFQVEWDSATNETRWRSNFNDWTDWGQCYTNTFTYVQGFYLQGGGGTGKLKTNLDSIGAACGVGNCGVCQVYTSCIAGGCTWYYSIYLQEYLCIEPVEPDPEDCDAFYKCQFCGDQTNCEAQLNCEWIDRGFGDQCYMIEPTVPPDQIDWEVPDIDDCSGLPALDTIVCEIKNLISGIFMPSQESLESLYQTIGAFKEKFPFNYVGVLNTFFENVAEDLEATSTIPIEILGATSTVNFTFWDATTTIGGQEETFKNILYDFTTFIVLMGWFVWLISLVKRFF